MRLSNYNCFCVYLHQNPKTEEVFYIGKGFPSRAYEINTRKGAHTKVLKSLLDEGYSIWDIVKIHKSDMSNRDALDLEKSLIIAHRNKNSPLVNITHNVEPRKPKPRPKKYQRHRKYKSRCWN